MLFLVTTLVAIHSGKRYTCRYRFLSSRRPQLGWNAAGCDLKYDDPVSFCLHVCSEFLVSSIETVVAEYGLPESFIGVILLPIVGVFS